MFNARNTFIILPSIMDLMVMLVTLTIIIITTIYSSYRVGRVLASRPGRLEASRVYARDIAYHA